MVREKNVTVSEMEKTKLEAVEPKPGAGSVREFEQLWAGNPVAALEELFELLEEYAPTWYTEAHHNHAIAALTGRTSS